MFARSTRVPFRAVSPAMATFLYTDVDYRAPGLLYVVFGCLSLFGSYINYFCGGNQVESDTGGDLELQQQQEASKTQEGNSLPAIS